MPQSRIALETGMHSPWVSRLLSELGHEVIVAQARNVRLIGESRKKDDRLDARRLARLVRIDPQLLAARAASQCPSASAFDGDPGASRTGSGADVVHQYGAGTDQVLRRAVARLRSAEHEPGEEAVAFFGIGSVGNAPRLLECLDVEKPQGTQMIGHSAGRQLLHREELGLVFPNMPRAQAIRRAVEVLCESFDQADIALCGSL
jgi:hypothetical protein